MRNQLDNLGLTCDILRAKNETEHFHRNIELLFIINGHIHVVVEGNEFLLKKEEFLLINSDRMHYIYVDEEAVVCYLKIPYELLSGIIGEEYVSFWCNHLTSHDIGYKDLTAIIRDIIMLRFNDDKRDGFRLMENYARLMDFLVRNYKISTSEKLQGDASEDTGRIQEILHYLNANYQEPITLQSLADQMFVSVSTLSRIFKKTTGEKFPDYMNRIRMHYAVEDLLNSNKSITEIAMDNGFSGSSSFNRVFKEMYETTPSQYKKSFRNTLKKETARLTEEEEGQVREYLKDQIAEQKVENSPIIPIYQNAETRFQPISTQTVSLGAFYQLPNSAVQKQLVQMIDQLHLSYIRTWNIFSPKCMIAVSPEEKNLSFEFIDQGLDFLVQHHVHPFLDMTDHPEVLIQNGRKLFFKREDSMGFQNKEQWTYFLEQLMDHVVFRYGQDEVSQWIFEFGDYSVDSDISYYHHGSAYYDGNEFGEVFETAYRIIKSYCPAAMVGGPDWIFDGREIDLAPHFQMWEERKVFPDFYSVHIFPYVNKDYATFNNERNMDPDFMANQMYQIRNQLQAVGAPKRPLYITETTTILSNRNAMNDHCARGTNVLRITNLFQNDADMVCFWVATDRLSLHYAPSGILHGGSGLMSKDGIPKPSYFALYFLSKLGKDLLSKGPGYMAVRNTPNSIYILCYNHKNLSYDYKYEEENVVNVHNVDTMFENNGELSLQFMVYGLKAGGEYVVKRHIVNQKYGSVMDEWKRLGFEPQMRSNDISYLKSVCVPRIQMEHRVAEDGQIFLEARLQPHEMLLLHVYR